MDKDDLNKDTKLFNQAKIFKYFCNFERDDIETIIDNQIVNIKYSKEDSKYYIRTIKIIFKNYYCKVIYYFMNLLIYIKSNAQILILHKSLIVLRCFQSVLH